MFHDKLSGIKLDIFGNGESTVIPDCTEEKLATVKKAIDANILVLDSKETRQDDQGEDIVIPVDDTRMDCADILLLERDVMLETINKEEDLDRLKTLDVLEKTGKNRAVVIDRIKTRTNAITSKFTIQSEPVDESDQITNIIETKKSTR